MSESQSPNDLDKVGLGSNLLGGSQNLQEMMAAFWQGQMSKIDQGLVDFKFHQLPLARIKKVMKSDDDVKVRLFL